MMMMMMMMMKMIIKTIMMTAIKRINLFLKKPRTTMIKMIIKTIMMTVIKMITKTIIFIQSEQPDAVLEWKLRATRAYHQMTEHSALQRTQEVLQFQPDDDEGPRVLAKRYRTDDDTDQCQHTGMKLLRY